MNETSPTVQTWSSQCYNVHISNIMCKMAVPSTRGDTLHHRSTIGHSGPSLCQACLSLTYSIQHGAVELASTKYHPFFEMGLLRSETEKYSNAIMNLYTMMDQ